MDVPEQQTKVKIRVIDNTNIANWVPFHSWGTRTEC